MSPFVGQVLPGGVVEAVNPDGKTVDLRAGDGRLYRLTPGAAARLPAPVLIPAIGRVDPLST